MRIPVIKDSPVPIYRQIQRFIAEQIETGILTAGTQLPSNRELAAKLGISRIVVANAYAELESQGLVFGRRGSGTYVAPQYTPPINSTLGSSPADWPLWQQALYAHSWHASHQELDKLLCSAMRPGIISFAERLGPDLLWPMKDISKAIQVSLRSSNQVIGMGHNNIAGHFSLRETIAQILSTEGIPAHPEQLMITSGSQQALNLVAHALLKPGDTVLVESPTYNVAIDLFRSMNIHLLGIPVDDQGMQVERIEASFSATLPRLIYTIPTFHNPTGTCLSGQRRRQLVALAERHNIPILEDDYIGNMRYEGRAEPALKALDRGGGVIYAGTFSKLFMPSLRIGYLTASGPIFDRLLAYKYITDLVTSEFLQRAVCEFINVGRYHFHIRRVSLAYRQRRDAMAKALQTALPECHWITPKGGGYIWLQLPDNLSSDKFFHFAAQAGVTFVPGSFFYPGQRSQSFLRLNFAINEPADIVEGVARLASAYQQLVRQKGKLSSG